MIEPAAIKLIQIVAGEMCKEFSEAIPLVDSGSMREKLTRLSIAIAARTFSEVETEKGSTLMVRECHVKFIANTLQRIYSSKTFGYALYSKVGCSAQERGDVKLIKRELEAASGQVKILIEGLLYTDKIDITDIQDWLGVSDSNIARRLLGLLRTQRALIRIGVSRYYCKSPWFIEWLQTTTFISAPNHEKF
jgi:hypothetical protein